MDTRPYRSAALTLVILITLIAVCFWRLVANPAALIVDGQRPSIDFANPGEPRPIGNDLTFLFLPHHLFISRSIGETGRWPMWDPTGFGGRPMLGNPQAGLFYPPVWLTWFAWAPSALGWLTIAHLIWGGVGTYILARLSNISRYGATVAACCFQAAPYILGHVFEGHYPHVWGVCWFPWAFWAFDSRRLKRCRGIVTLPLIVALVYVVGHPQEGFLLGLALTFRAFVDWTRSDKREGVLVRWIGVMLVTLGLAAIDLIPQIAIRSWKLQTISVANSPSEIPGRYSLRVINLLQLLTPEALGGPSDFDGYDNSWETMLSFGLVPFILAIAALQLHPDRQTVRGWLILAGLTLWVACGYKLGLYALLYHLVPGMNLFRVPARPIFLTSLAIALLAGFGVDALKTSADWKRLGRILLGGLTLLLITFALVAATSGTLPSRAKPSAAPAATEVSNKLANDPTQEIEPLTPPDRMRGWGREQRAIARVIADPRVWILLVSVGTLIGVGTVRTRWNSQRAAAYGLGILTFLELGYWGHSLLQVAPPGRFLGHDPVSEAIARSKPQEDQLAPRLKAKDTFYGDLRAISNGFEKTNIDDSFQLRHSAVLYQELYSATSRPRLHKPEVDENRRVIRQRIFDMMAVDFLVSNRVEADLGWPVSKRGAWDEHSEFVIQTNPTAMPRAYIVGRAEIVDADPESFLSRCRTLTPKDSVLMLDDPLVGLPATTDERQSFTPASWISAEPDHLELRVSIEKPGLLVIADTWMPGWSALVDGKSEEILRGNFAQRVIPIREAGSHTIMLDYSPPGLYLGSGVFVSTLGLWAILCGRIIMRDRDQSRPTRDASESTIPASGSS